MSAEHWQSVALAHEFNTYRALHGGILPAARLHRDLFGESGSGAARLAEVGRMVDYLKSVFEGRLDRMREIEASTAGPVVAVHPETPLRLAQHLLRRDTGFDADMRERQRRAYTPIVDHLAQRASHRTQDA